MQIFALIGRRGTGKSHHAQLVAHQNKIYYIIDDGLLIKGNHILAGRSAKRENTGLGAVKRAIMDDPEHAHQLREKLSAINPERLLIVATSRKMASTITGKLGLPDPARYIEIEDIASPEAISTALTIRAKENRHVIPIPTFSVKKDFPGYLIDPLRSFFRMPAAQPQAVAVERSIVRPVYSNLGKFFIAEHVVYDLVGHIARQVPGVYKVARTEYKNVEKKVVLNIDLVLSFEHAFDLNLVNILKQVQGLVKKQVEYLTGFYLDRVNVSAKKLHLELNPAQADDHEPETAAGN